MNLSQVCNIQMFLMILNDEADSARIQSKVHIAYNRDLLSWVYVRHIVPSAGSNKFRTIESGRQDVSSKKWSFFLNPLILPTWYNKRLERRNVSPQKIPNIVAPFLCSCPLLSSKKFIFYLNHRQVDHYGRVSPLFIFCNIILRLTAGA